MRMISSTVSCSACSNIGRSSPFVADLDVADAPKLGVLALARERVDPARDPDPRLLAGHVRVGRPSRSEALGDGAGDRYGVRGHVIARHNHLGSWRSFRQERR